MGQIKLFGNTDSRRTKTSEKPQRPHRALRVLIIVLSVLLLLEALYFTCVYSNIPFITKWRNIYIQTAMSTMRHQWLATAFIPKDVIDEVMAAVEQGRQDQVGLESTWGGGDAAAPGGPTVVVDTPDDDTPDVPQPDAAEEAFYELFWEIDRDSMEAYLERHPDVLDDGWENLYINEAGLEDDGTDIETTMGEQVLAIDAPNQVLLVRVKGSGYRGVLAVAKDPARLSVKNSASLGASGQLAGTIAKNNDGVLAMTASGFIDVDAEGNEGKGNGGILAGFAMSDGEGRGTHMGWSFKRIELRENNLMYITDAQSEVHPDTTDAVEFSPALIVDGEITVSAADGFTALNPRACIGQSEKGEILMLIIEGRLLGYSTGADAMECADILARHDCMQAMNLDGGTSAILWYDGEYVTRCSNPSCPEGRTLPNAFVYARG